MITIVRKYIPKWIRTSVMVIVLIGVIVAMFYFQRYRYLSRTKERCDYLDGELIRVETLHKSYVTCSAHRITPVEE